MNAGKPPLKLWQKLLLVGFSLGSGLIVSLAAGELWLRLRTPQSIRLQNNQILLPKNQRYVFHNVSLRDSDATITHQKNSIGFRGAEPPLDFQNFLTIVAVGGSTTECFYLSDGQSWPERVQSRLEKTIQRLWINNAGLDGHSTYGHRILLHDFLSKLHPKVILYLVGINDVGRDDLTPSPWEDTSEKSRLERCIADSRIAAWLKNIGRAWLARRRGLAHGSVDLRSVPVLKVSPTDSEALRRAHRTGYVPGYEARLNTLIRDTRAAGIEPVLLTQPVMFGLGIDPVTGVNLEAIEIDKVHNGRVAWEILELYNDATRKIAREQHILLIDLARTMPKTSTNFYDFYHFTRTGADVTARIVCDKLLPFLQRRYPEFTSR